VKSLQARERKRWLLKLPHEKADSKPSHEKQADETTEHNDKRLFHGERHAAERPGSATPRQ
jgi:hypothetical protein